MAIKKIKQRPKPSAIVLAIFFAALIAIAALIGVVAADVTGVDIGEDSKSIEVRAGESGYRFAEILRIDEIIKYPQLMKLKIKLAGSDKPIYPGTIEIKNGMSYNEILELAWRDDRESIKFTVPEGYEQKQIAAKLEQEGICSAADFEAATHDAYGYAFLNGLPERAQYLEGYLFPDTYFIPEGASAHDIIDMMLSQFDATFTDEMRERANEMGYSVDQIVTMASVIERETDSDSERAKVAGVFYNRIKKGMKLQSCATVQYILGERKPVLSVADTKTQSPYTTYLNAGLPVGPIANPGADCLKAALYPEATEYYYFVQGKNGQHIFSKTYEEHLAAMNGTESAVQVDSGAIHNEDNLQNGAN